MICSGPYDDANHSQRIDNDRTKKAFQEPANNAKT